MSLSVFEFIQKKNYALRDVPKNMLQFVAMMERHIIMNVNWKMQNAVEILDFMLLLQAHVLVIMKVKIFSW